jgi:hypothetical protein
VSEPDALSPAVSEEVDQGPVHEGAPEDEARADDRPPSIDH